MAQASVICPGDAVRGFAVGALSGAWTRKPRCCTRRDRG